MKTLLYPGTFDPVTNGHMDLIERGSRLFDRLVVGVAAAHHRERTLFTLEERLDLVRAATRGMAGVEAVEFRGLLVQFARSVGARAVLRGLRAISDYEYETQMAFMNRRLDREIEILFLPADEKYTYVNATLVKEIARLGGDVAAFVPAVVLERLRARIREEAG
jgi:pantetheine-phosphate adenylyltransferase